MIRLQHLYKHEVLVARVLDVVAVRLGEVRDVARAVVERGGLVRGREQGRAALALDEEAPLVARRVPVDLAHAAGLHGHHGGGEVGGDGEGQRVDDLDAAPGHLVRGLLGEVVRVAGRFGNDAAFARHVLRLDVLGGGGSGEDVQLVRGDLVEGGGGDAEVLGQDFFLQTGLGSFVSSLSWLWKVSYRVVVEDFRSKKRVVFGESSVVEHQQELHTGI